MGAYRATITMRQPDERPISEWTRTLFLGIRRRNPDRCARRRHLSPRDWEHWKSPEPLPDPTVNYLVLAAALALEGGSWTLAVREFKRAKGQMTWWTAIRDSKDPATFMVLLQDSAALAGLLVAAVGKGSS
jgi:hypothetical protein